MSISSIDNEIKYYNNQISETNKFINNLNNLKNNTSKVIEKLNAASENLKQGLTLDGVAADNGVLETYSATLKSSITSIEGAISTATSNLRTFSSKVSSLNAQRRRLLEEMKKNEQYKF